MKKVRLWVSIAVSASLLTAVAVAELEGTHPMKCRSIEAPNMERERTRFEAEHVYQVQGTDRSTVRFRFGLAANADESRFAIKSHRIGALVYKGPYRREISVEIDSNLAKDDGWDNLEFHLFDPGKKQACSSTNDRGYQFWRPGAEISVAFLREPVIDDNGLRKEYDVTIGP